MWTGRRRGGRDLSRQEIKKLKKGTSYTRVYVLGPLEIVPPEQAIMPFDITKESSLAVSLINRHVSAL